MSTTPKLALADGTPAGEAVAPSLLALVEANLDALRAVADLASAGGRTEATTVLFLAEVDAWPVLVETLQPGFDWAPLRARAERCGGTVMASGFQPEEYLVALLSHVGDDVGLLLRELRERRPGHWRVLVCFDGGLALAGIPVSGRRSAATNGGAS